jgi:hypothetical protein
MHSRQCLETHHTQPNPLSCLLEKPSLHIGAYFNQIYRPWFTKGSWSTKEKGQAKGARVWSTLDPST